MDNPNSRTAPRRGVATAYLYRHPDQLEPGLRLRTDGTRDTADVLGTGRACSPCTVLPWLGRERTFS
jgi:hypothetical protein